MSNNPTANVVLSSSSCGGEGEGLPTKEVSKKKNQEQDSIGTSTINALDSTNLLINHPSLKRPHHEIHSEGDSNSVGPLGDQEEEDEDDGDNDGGSDSGSDSDSIHKKRPKRGKKGENGAGTKLVPGEARALVTNQEDSEEEEEEEEEEDDEDEEEDEDGDGEDGSTSLGALPVPVTSATPFEGEEEEEEEEEEEDV